jgi:PBP1b-binding outer membrane lipoprotein LpoB
MRINFDIAAFVMAIAMVFGACRSENEPTHVAEVTKARDVAAKPNTPEQVCVPKPVEFPEQGQTSAIPGACETLAGSDYIEKTADHLKNVAVLMRENVSDCRTVLIEVSKYIEANKVDIEDAIKAGDEAQSRMSEQEKRMLAQRVKELFGPIMQDVGSVSAEFANKCRSDVKKLSELLKTLDGQAGGL